MKKIIITSLIIFIQFALVNNFTVAANFENSHHDANIENKVISAITFENITNSARKINQNSESYISGIQKATDRYMQTNVIAAYKDFSNIIYSINDKNDFLYVTLAQRLDNLGFFTLSQNAIINIKDLNLWRKPINALKSIYNPSVTLTYDEEIYLAQLQASTLYNNSAKETIKELSKNEKLLKKSDYANYVLAVAYFENKNYSKAMNSINKAIHKAPDCINYLLFKSKIYSQMENYKDALKIIKNIKKIKNTKLIANYYNDLLNNDELYILIKTSKKDMARYYSAKLLFQTGESQKALKEAQAAITLNKNNLDAYSLIGDYYIQNNDSEKAKEYYLKAYEKNGKFAPALIGLGHYYFINKNYNTAYEYYLKAYKYSKNKEQALICLANCLITKDGENINVNDKNNALFYLKRAIKINPNSDKAYYLLSKITPEMKEQYLRNAISLNPANIYAWLDLSELYFSQNKIKEANEYLFPAELINPEDPKYIYLKNAINSNEKSGFKSSVSNTDSLNLIF